MVVAIDDDVKIKIMHSLRDSERSFEGIANSAGRAKSTMSRHLKKLERNGLISSRRDHKDKRKKIYKCESKLLGITTQSKPILDKKTLIDINSSIDGSVDFINLIFRSIRYKFDSLGIEIAPVLHTIGEQIGLEISKKMSSTNIDGTLGEIADFWRKHRLGEVEVVQKNPLIFIVHNCYACSDMPDIGKTLCAFDEGILESIFSYRLSAKCIVKETECSGSGFGHCKFVAVFS